ncbi:MAG: N-acetyl-gamma-glutamyl-phosphate reductase [Alphaproteobacteria bacterium]|nr:N-acetyl-gamma-glutamyl-phosphate reductase [Alphaproteobacteria bacterium]
MAGKANGTSGNQVRIAILGASGYTGAELVRLLARHPNARIVALTGDRNAGQPLAQVFPHLRALKLPDLIKIEDVRWDGVDLVFCALPHGTTQKVIAGLPAHLKVVDLSADFRLKDAAEYARWYGHPHQALELQKEAVYGLTEIKRAAVKAARLVANPGCYPTSAQLPLIPLLADGLVEEDGIIVDSKSGVTGAGRSLKEANLYPEAAEGIHAYAVGSHRHGPEIEQGLAEAAGKPITVTFTPHLMPMSRGILSTIYVKARNGAKADDLRASLLRAYEGEPFVTVVPQGESPATRHVRGSNHVHIGVFPARATGRAVLVCAIDNLVKGASGQAVQNMNVMLGLPETTALDQQPMFP